MALLIRILAGLGIGLLVVGFLIGTASGPRPAHWVRAMDPRGLLRRVRIGASGPDQGLQKAGAIMIAVGFIALLVATALLSGSALTLWGE